MHRARPLYHQQGQVLGERERRTLTALPAHPSAPAGAPAAAAAPAARPPRSAWFRAWLARPAPAAQRSGALRHSRCSGGRGMAEELASGFRGGSAPLLGVLCPYHNANTPTHTHTHTYKAVGRTTIQNSQASTAPRMRGSLGGGSSAAAASPAPAPAALHSSTCISTAPLSKTRSPPSPWSTARGAGRRAWDGAWKRAWRRLHGRRTPRAGRTQGRDQLRRVDLLRVVFLQVLTLGQVYLQNRAARCGKPRTHHGLATRTCSGTTAAGAAHIVQRVRQAQLLQQNSGTVAAGRRRGVEVQAARGRIGLAAGDCGGGGGRHPVGPHPRRGGPHLNRHGAQSMLVVSCPCSAPGGSRRGGSPEQNLPTPAWPSLSCCEVHSRAATAVSDQKAVPWHAGSVWATALDARAAAISRRRHQSTHHAAGCWRQRSPLQNALSGTASSQILKSADLSAHLQQGFWTQVRQRLPGGGARLGAAILRATVFNAAELLL